jgi:hypothetical protein
LSKRNENRPGYKKTGVAWIPEEWYTGKLNKTLKPKRPITYGIVQPGSYYNNGRFMIRSQDYANGWVSRKNIFRVSAEIEKLYKKSRVFMGDIVFTVVGGKFRAFRTPIPGDSGHEFRFNSDSDSGLISDSFML